MASQPAAGGGDEALGPQPALTVSAVARRLGVAPATLRTWDRRYGLGPSAHQTGAHRRYSTGDVARLEAMRRYVVQGVTPQEAARLVRAGAVPSPDGGEGSAHRSHPGGGRVVSLQGASTAAQGLARAALALDAATCSRTIRASLERRGVVATWQDLLVPVLLGVGQRWESTHTGVDAEHLLSECATGALRAVSDRLDPPANARPVLLACADEEQHSLPLHAVAAGLAERHVGSRVLGARVPRVALADAVRRTGPSVVFLWSALARTGDPDQLGELPRLRPASVVVAGGPGWDRDRMPRDVEMVDDLAETIELVVRAALG